MNTNANPNPTSSEFYDLLECLKSGRMAVDAPPFAGFMEDEHEESFGGPESDQNFTERTERNNNEQ